MRESINLIISQTLESCYYGDLTFLTIKTLLFCLKTTVYKIDSIRRQCKYIDSKQAQIVDSSRMDDYLLIHEVEKRVGLQLYDHSDLKYKDKRQRDAGWRAVSEAVGITGE